MQSVRLDQLIPSVQDKLPATPLRGQVIRSLREAAQTFCFETEIWKEPLAAVDVVSGQVVYDLSTTWQAEIRRIHSVCLKTAADITAGRLGDPRDCSLDTYTPATGEYRFFSAPSTSNIEGGLAFTCVLVPNLQTDELPQWIIGLYGMAFVFASIADLCSHKGAGPLYDEKTADKYARKYEKMKSNAMAEVFRQNMNASPAIQPQYNLAGAFNSIGSGYRVGG